MGIKSKVLQALGRDAPYVQVLPVPVSVNRAPQSSYILPAGDDAIAFVRRGAKNYSFKFRSLIPSALNFTVSAGTTPITVNW